jgi:EmrB/QacA subfamily drug resistance transporter
VASDRHSLIHSRWLIFGVTSSALLLVSIDGTVVATALPTLSRQLGASIAWTTWTITAYALGTVTAFPLAGRLSDLMGRKRMFLLFASTFTVASLCCGLVGNIFVLIGFRFVQALGGSGLMPSTAGVISDLFGSDRDRPIGLMTSIFPLGAMIGPVLGGVIVTYFSWRVIFFINIPIGLVLITMLWTLLPSESPPPRRTLRIDVIGAGLFALTILSLMLGTNELGQQGWNSVVAWSLLVITVVFAGAFWYRQEHSPSPILPLALLKQRQFAVVNGLNLVYGAAALGIFSLVPLYAQTRYGMPPLEAGGLLTIRAAAMAVMSAVTALLLVQRFGYRRPMLAGFVLIAIGLLLLSVAPATTSGFTWLTLACVVCGLGIGLAGPPSNNASLQLMPTEVAAISGLRGTFRQTGAIVSISVAAAIIAGSAQVPTVLAYVFASLGALTLIAAPAIFGVPENPSLRRSKVDGPVIVPRD